MQVLIVGCGYVGMALGSELLRSGHAVFGLRRNPPASDESSAPKWLAGDITRPETLRDLPKAYDWVVHCVSSSQGTPADYQAVYLEGTRNVLNWLADSPPRKFVYTSSTGVYSQTDGSMVEESSPTIPLTDTNRVLIETERALLHAARETAFPAVILRVAGIYGPGRGHWLRQFLSGEARLEGNGGRWLNMIHRDDVAGAIIAVLQAGKPAETYNACDNEPVQLLTLFQWLAATLHKPMPPAVSERQESASKRGVTNKRVSNHKLREACGWKPRYPTFREGYARELKVAADVRH